MNKVDVLYEDQKKSVIIAYLLGAFLGGFGLHFFYTKHHELGFITLGLLVVSLLGPVLNVIFLMWVLSGVVVTYYTVKDYNEKLRKRLETILE